MRTSLLLLALFSIAGCAGEATITGPAPGPGPVTTPPPAVVSEPPTRPALRDDAAVVAVTFPTQLEVGQLAQAAVTLKNTGETSWTKVDGFQLGAVDGSDPFVASSRVELDVGEVVAPGASRTFTLPLVSPASPGVYVSDWRMTRVSTSFGATLTPSVTVTPVALSSAKELTRFALLGVEGTITGTTVTVTVPAMANLGSAVPTLTHTGVSISPDASVARNFNAPVTYTVTAADGSTRAYSVTATHAAVPPGTDAIDLATVQVFNSPADVASWPITTHITQLEMRSPDVGLVFDFPAKATWPDYTPPGWDGPLQYTVWAVVNVGGAWYTSGYIQMWNGRYSTGAPLISDFAPNWAYDGRWGPMMGHQPVAGEQMGFFVTAGNARGVPDVTSLRERSNVVLVTLPAGDNGVFNF